MKCEKCGREMEPGLEYTVNTYDRSVISGTKKIDENDHIYCGGCIAAFVVETDTMSNEKIYSDIKRWGHVMGSFAYYVEMQIKEARRENAPYNAIYKSGGKWITTDDITAGATKDHLKTLAHIV